MEINSEQYIYMYKFPYFEELLKKSNFPNIALFYHYFLCSLEPQKIKF